MNGDKADDLKAASARVREAAASAGLVIEIRTHAQSTRTAEAAAAACGCAIGQIVKSLVFQGKTTGGPILLLVSGANRVNEKGIAASIGEALRRPDAAYVREVTGYAIGGIPPIGHATPLKTFVDRDLMPYASVWAAAGTPDSVFQVAPAALVAATAATIIEVT